MREMNEKEQRMFNIIKNNRACRNDNWKALQTFYQEEYGISLPDLSKCDESFWTIERMIRMLKSLYPSELTDPQERQIKADREDLYKEQALDKNKPIKPAKEEQMGLGLFGEINGWW